MISATPKASTPGHERRLGFCHDICGKESDWQFWNTKLELVPKCGGGGLHTCLPLCPRGRSAWGRNCPPIGLRPCIIHCLGGTLGTSRLNSVQRLRRVGSHRLGGGPCLHDKTHVGADHRIGTSVPQSPREV